MKLKILTLLSIFIMTVSCDSDDGSNDSGINLVGTTWIAIENQEEQKSFEFINETDYIYREQGAFFPGKYEFDGEKEGRLLETNSDPEALLFEVENNILSVDQQDAVEGLETKYTRE